MTKIYSGELHRNDNASIEFGAAIVGAVHHVRVHMANLADSRKADEYAPGAIHVLRKLCEGEGKPGHIHQVEVAEWQETFFAWFKRVEKRFPPALAKKFKANAEEDFAVILQSADAMPESFWRNEIPKRHLLVTFDSDAAVAAARKAAEEKYPVQLGSALHKYIESCVAELVGDEPSKPAPQPKQPADRDSLPMRFMWHDNRVLSLIVDSFHCFDTPDDLEQDIVVTAYDVEDAVKQYLARYAPAKSVAALKFDCESSMFVALSSDASALSWVALALLEMAADGELFAEHRAS